MKRMLFVVAVAALDVRMGRVGAQRRAAGVPSEVVQLITGVGYVHASDGLLVGLRVWINI